MVAVLALRSSGSCLPSTAAEGGRSSDADASASVVLNGEVGKGGKGGLGLSHRRGGKAAADEGHKDTLVVPMSAPSAAWASGGQRALAAAAGAMLLLLLVNQGLTGGPLCKYSCKNTIFPLQNVEASASCWQAVEGWAGSMAPPTSAGQRQRLALP